MNLDFLCGYVRFDSFESVISWLCSSAPAFYIGCFVLSCFFAILDVMIHLGGRK